LATAVVTSAMLRTCAVRLPAMEFTLSQVDIAEYTGVSRRQLQRLFERYLKCTPSRYYAQIRLARARELLHQTGMSLVEISALTGFVSSSHFSKSYKEQFGHSPSAERKR
jgi:transcriptional regulator GlxA family with amidase domain